MSTKSREVIFGSRIRGAKIHADGARERAKQAVREADRAEAEAWSIRMEGYGGPAQPSQTNGGRAAARHKIRPNDEEEVYFCRLIRGFAATSLLSPGYSRPT